MVAAVKEQRSRDPKAVDEVFDAIASLVHEARKAIGTGEHATLGERMNDNQAMLRDLLLSTPRIERLCALARSAGAFGAKLTGAGGGGSVVALVSDKLVADAVLTAWTKDGYRGFVTRVAPDHRPLAVERAEVLGASPFQ
jgi:mevalonate kinase